MADELLPGASNTGSQASALKTHWPLWAVLAADWGASLWMGLHLGPRVPLHWDIHGQINGWGTRWEAVGIWPALATVIYGFLAILEQHPLRIESIHPMPRSLKRQIQWIVVAFLLAMQWAYLLPLRLGGIPSFRILFLTLALFTILLGNLLPRLEPNGWIGVRTPATLGDRSVWRATHRFGGRLMVAAGIAQLLACGLPMGVFLIVLILSCVLPWIGCIAYANRLTRALASRSGIPNPAAPCVDRGRAQAPRPLWSWYDLLPVVALGMAVLFHRIQPHRVPWWLLGLPVIAWLLLWIEASLHEPGEVRRACVQGRGWLVLGLVICLVPPIHGVDSGVWQSLLQIALLNLSVWIGQLLTKRSAEAEGRQIWIACIESGGTLWNRQDPRILVPKQFSIGWSCNFAHLASWLLLAGLAAPFLAMYASFHH